MIQINICSIFIWILYTCIIYVSVCVCMLGPNLNRIVFSKMSQLDLIRCIAIFNANNTFIDWTTTELKYVGVCSDVVIGLHAIAIIQPHAFVMDWIELNCSCTNTGSVQWWSSFGTYLMSCESPSKRFERMYGRESFQIVVEVRSKCHISKISPWQWERDCSPSICSNSIWKNLTV